MDPFTNGQGDHNVDIPLQDAGGFNPSAGLTSHEASNLLQVHGRNELKQKSTPKWIVFLRQLQGPMPILIWIAILVELFIRNWLDAFLLLTIQTTNATIAWYESIKAADAVAALKKSLRQGATVKRDGSWQEMDAANLVPGDLVLLGSGSSVPADCNVNEGSIDVDQSALTGESHPVSMQKGDLVKLGSTVVRGEVEATVQSTGKNTFLGKTAAMLQSVDELGSLQKTLLQIMFVLVTASLGLCLMAFINLVSRRQKVEKALEFVVVLMVASIPIAIEIVTVCTLALGSRQLAAMDAIVTRLVAIEEMAGMNMLCSDKTGTLTLNKMVIQDNCPVFVKGETRDTVLTAAALAAKWREPPRDALDTMILGAVDLNALDAYKQLDYMPFDPTVKRTEATLQARDGSIFRTTKGVPYVVLGLCANKANIADEFEKQVASLGERGIRCLAVARAEGDGPWRMLGLLTFLDPPRPDTKRTLDRAKEYGVAIKMITGDQVIIAQETSRSLGLGTTILGVEGLPSLGPDGQVPLDLRQKYGRLIADADGFAQVYPEHKYIIVEALRQEGYYVGMAGDGVNDAPALKRADVGIAVSGATDAARAASDIVITSPGLSVVVEAIIIARCIFQRVKSFITYRVAATLQLLLFFFIAVFTDPRDYAPLGETWPPVFQLPVLMLMLITLLNDGTLITIGYDHVVPSQKPEKLNLKVLFLVSSVLAAVACGSSLIILYAAFDSNKPGGLFHSFGFSGLAYGQIVTLVYLKVSVSDFLTLFSARTTSFFWTQRPGTLLLGGAIGALTFSTVLACSWPRKMSRDGTVVEVLGLWRGNHKALFLWLWVYCLICWLIQDVLKVLTYKLIYRFNIFGAVESVAARPTSDGLVEGGVLGSAAGRGEFRQVGMSSANGRGSSVSYDAEVQMESLEPLPGARMNSASALSYQRLLK